MSVSRTRAVALGTLMVVVALIATAFALGGNSNSSNGSGGATSQPARIAVHGPATSVAGLPATGGDGASSGSTSGSGAAGSAGFGRLAPGASAPGSGTAVNADAVTGVSATRVVKTGDLELSVKRGQVQAIVNRIINFTTGEGGYVSQSRTDNLAGSPSASLTLRMPAADFDQTVTALAKDGHETSLTTTAHDVTGKFVDLNARLSALQRTRSTYLTILGGAKTIGSTLEVQQRVDEVQQQIEELQGELKVLRNQSVDGTLNVDVSQAGSATVLRHHHQRKGLAKAWHTSISRFARGFDAIVGALGPLLLVLLILGFIAIVGRLGYRGVRRATT